VKTCGGAINNGRAAHLKNKPDRIVDDTTNAKQIVEHPQAVDGLVF